jgi:hypothetical protein
VMFITIVSNTIQKSPHGMPWNPLNFQPMILLPFHNFPVPSCSPAQRRTSAQFDPKWIQPAFGLRMALGMKPDVHNRRNVLLLPSVFSTSLLDLPKASCARGLNPSEISSRMWYLLWVEAGF